MKRSPRPQVLSGWGLWGYMQQERALHAGLYKDQSGIKLGRRCTKAEVVTLMECIQAP